MNPGRAIAAAVAGSLAAAYIGAGRSRQLRWGAANDEVDAALAGDDLITAPDLTATRAITIPAPADLIWPWIAQLRQGRALVIRGGIPMGAVPCPYDCTWVWVLREQPDGTSRLIVRERYTYTQRWAPFLLEPVQVISFVMAQRMLRGIKERAERSALPTALLKAGQRYAGPACRA